MSRSARSVITVLISVFIACFVTWIYLRGKAAAKPIKPAFNHSFLKIHDGGRSAVFLQLPNSNDGATIEALAEDVRSTNASPTAPHSVGLWLDVRLNGSSDLVVSRTELLKNGKPIEIASLDECRADGVQSAKDVIAGLSHGDSDKIKSVPMILNLISRRPGLPQKFYEVWGVDKPFRAENTLVQSDADGILKEIRDSEPRGLFGSSQSTLIQIEILSNLMLAGLPDLKSDVLVSFNKEVTSQKSMARVRESTLNEAHRRGLRRYAGPALSKEEAETLLSEKYDGVIVEDRAIWDALRKSSAAESNNTSSR